MNNLKLPIVLWLILQLVQGGSTFKTSDSVSFSPVIPANPSGKSEELRKLTKRNTENGKINFF